MSSSARDLASRVALLSAQFVVQRRNLAFEGALRPASAIKSGTTDIHALQYPVFYVGNLTLLHTDRCRIELDRLL